jgi:hypothetical protein
MPFRSFVARVAAVSALALIPGAAAEAQDPTPPAVDTTQNAAIRAYLDCNENGCDHDFIKTEMKWINWMRDRLDADFHILVTTEQTGAGGRRYTVLGIGQRAYAGKGDTLTFVSNPNDASDAIRTALMQTIGKLLVSHAAKGPLGPALSISYKAPEGGTAQSGAPTDKWDFWTFSISGNGFMDGESRQSFKEMWSDLSGNRTTEAWKIRINLNTSLGTSRFTYDTGTPPVEVVDKQTRRASNVSAMAVKSFGEHWSFGARGIASSTVYNNLKLATQVSAAAEWDLFPYKDFTRKRLAVLYTIGVRDLNYNDTTIYDKMEETRPVHTLDATLAARQKWGDANVTLFGSQYLDEFKYYNLGIRGGVDVQLGKGLSFEINGQLSRVRNQLYLAKAGETQSEVLQRLRALQTNYRYFTFFGIRYQFGSIFNSVVNPRFGNINGTDDF